MGKQNKQLRGISTMATDSTIKTMFYSIQINATTCTSAKTVRSLLSRNFLRENFFMSSFRFKAFSGLTRMQIYFHMRGSNFWSWDAQAAWIFEISMMYLHHATIDCIGIWSLKDEEYRWNLGKTSVLWMYICSATYCRCRIFFVF